MDKKISYKRSNIQLLGLFTAPFFAMAIIIFLTDSQTIPQPLPHLYRYWLLSPMEWAFTYFI